MKKLYTFIVVFCLFYGCSTVHSDEWNTFTLDPPNKNLRGHDDHGANDKPEADCNPEKHFSCDPKADVHCNPNQVPACDPETDSECVTTLEYKCIVRFISDDQRNLDYIEALRAQLKACQEHSPTN